MLCHSSCKSSHSLYVVVVYEVVAWVASYSGSYQMYCVTEHDYFPPYPS